MRTHGIKERIVVGLALAAVAVAPVLVQAPAEAATRVSIAATPAGILTGGHATFAGGVSTRSHRLVRLQLNSAGVWRNVAKARTTKRGKYLVADPSSRIGQYRVVMPRARVSGRTLRAVTSSTVTVGLASSLESGQTLQSGQFLTSPGGVYQLVMQPDGNLVLTTVADPATVVWSTNTAGHPGARLVMQYAGNLVLVDPANVLLWSTSTADAGSDLSVDDAGGVSVHDGTTVLWDRVAGVHVPTDPVGTSQAAVRGQTWVDAKVKYSQSKYYTNSYGRYRTDCSGFVSMMWGLSSSYTTRTIPSITTVITKDQLRSGDVLNSPGYHVVLFDAWANAAHTQYWAYEETPSSGAAHHVLPYPYWSSSRPKSFVPRRLSQ
ncbi:hypothetical protein D9V37_08375 [Nocardioides mangrovicus]|uniref:Bulb-type lectin domain-containing protein n=1 Tax=Nocardioides mangrovicus TaxID=2478913 RepID=A0A3L8P3E5_9ACTN|nr:hypothetical protein [Nocardioides mangrovicus]RLV49890.1 hypothetical protein D9V37_08375 [Nocardioides mangrovicus]